MATIWKIIILCSVYQILSIHFCSAHNVSAVFVFGDSLVEVGNNFYLNTFAKPVSPNGIDFAKGSPSGRYTNGRTVADIIEDELGFNYAPPYLAPNTTGDVILKGVNYASSGAGVLRSSGTFTPYSEHLSMDEQVNYFSKTRQDIISRLGMPAAQSLLRNALFLLIVGANDVLFQRISTTRDVNKYLDDVFGKFNLQLRRLYNLDARKIAVGNSPSVGCMPFMRDVFSTNNDCYSPANDLAKLFNSRLKILLQQLSNNLPASRFVHINNYAIFEDVLNNYRSYGFENVDSACCQLAGRHGGLVSCGPLSRICPDRTKFVFWDPFHPTESVNVIGAKHALDGGLEYVSPMNIRQLANS